MNLSRQILKKALQNLKSLLNEKGKAVSVTDKIPLARELESIKKQPEEK